MIINLFKLRNKSMKNKRDSGQLNSDGNEQMNL